MLTTLVGNRALVTGRYQLTAQTITLGEMSAWANRSAGVANTALVLEAAFMLWTGSFALGRFFGKKSKAELTC